MKNATLADYFASKSRVWHPSSAGADVGHGYLNMRPNRNHIGWDLHDVQLGNATICTEIINTTESAAATQSNSASGLAFWSAYLNRDTQPVIYAFFVSPTGDYAVWRLQHQKWASLLNTSHSDAIRTGPGARNVLTVVTQGNDATCYINGTRVGSIHNTQVRGSYGGLIAATSEQERAPITWRFSYYAYR